MSVESICGSFVPNGSDEIDNALNKGTTWYFTVTRVSVGKYRLLCDSFYNDVWMQDVALTLGTSPATNPGYVLYMGEFDMVSVPHTQDIVVYDSAGNPVDIPYAAGRSIGFDIVAVY